MWKIPPPSLQRYGIAVLSVGMALLLTLLLMPAIRQVPTPLFFAAVMFSSWYGGFRPGLLATLLAASCIHYLFLSPVYGLNFTVTDLLLLGVFVAVALITASLNAARLQAQKKLQQSEERFRSLVESVTDYAIFMLDPSGRVVSWNEGAERITGHTAKEIKGQHFSRFYTAADIEAGKPEQNLHRAAATGRLQEEGKRVRKDGSEFWANAILTALRDEGGHLLGFAKVTRDISQPVRAAQVTARALLALRQSQQQMQAILDNSPATICLKDTEGRFILANRQFQTLVNLTGEQLAGLTEYDLFPHEIAEALRANDQKVLEAGTPLQFEEVVPSGDGAHTYLSVKFPLRERAGVPYAICGISTDITDRKQAERERDRLLSQVARQARMLDDLLEASADYIYLIERTGKCAYASRRAAAVLGLELGDIAGKTWRELGLPVEFAETFEGQQQAVLATGEPVSGATSFPTAGGVRRCEYTLSPFRSPEGGVEAVVATFRDITDRVRAQEEREQLVAQLEREHQLLQAVLRQMPAGVIVAEAPSGKLILGNEQVERIWRHSFHPSESVEEYRAYSGSHPDGRPYRPEEWPLARSITAGEVAIGEEIEIRRGDGTAGAVRVSSAPIRDRDGRIVAGVVTFYDITEHKRIEKRQRFLAEASTLLMSSLDCETTLNRVAQLSAGDLADCCLVYLTGFDGQIQLVAAAHADPAKTDLLRQIERRHQPDPNSPHSLVAKALQTAEPVLLPEIPDSLLQQNASDPELLKLFRELKPQSALVVPMVLRERPIGAICLLASDSGRRYERADVALAEDLARLAAIAVENARLYRSADEANSLKEEFLAIVSHELRAPLTAIFGWAQLLRTGQLDEATRTRAIDTIARNAKSQAQLIEDLLDIARLMRGKIRLEVGPVDLVRLIEGVTEAMLPGAAAKKLRLECALDPEAAVVSGDSERLQQVISNLLSNAIKFTPPGGRVEVRLERAGSRAQIQVKDTGTGIAPDFLPFVFERFRQSDATTTRSQSGLGLGLAIVRQLVELHGGTVAADSPGPGQGATFTVRLPLAEWGRRHQALGAGEEQPAPSAQPTAPAAPLTGVRVLVVDDEADARDFLSAVLEAAGAQVAAAASAQEALEMLQRLSPNILVSDIGMPGEDGYALLRKVRSLEGVRGGGIPAIALTAYAREEDRRRALEAGFQLHLSKPVEPVGLTAAIANLVKIKN